MKQLCGVTWKPLGIISPGADRNVLSSHPFSVIETQAFSKGFPQMPWLCLGLLSLPKEKAASGRTGPAGEWVGSAAKVSLLSIVRAQALPSITSAASAVSGNSSSNMGHQLWLQAVPSTGWRNQFILEGFVNMRLHLKRLWDRTRTLLQVRSQSFET